MTMLTAYWNVFEKCILQDVRHNLWEILPE